MKSDTTETPPAAADTSKESKIESLVNFRTTREYREILEQFLVVFAYKHSLRAPDICVIATALGLVGTIPIRKGTMLPEMAEEIIAAAMDRGKEAFKELNRRMGVLAHKRRGHKGIKLN